jgi:hypothetical protein
LGYSLSLCGFYMLAYLLLYRDLVISLMLESSLKAYDPGRNLGFLWDPYNTIFKTTS